jgi:hypothetical protein
MADEGELLLNMNVTTGMVTVTVREPLGIHKSTVSVPPFVFLGLAHQIGAVACEQMTQQLATFQQQLAHGPRS